jgi:hypothetical protein
MTTHQILITFDSARDFRDRQFTNYDSNQMHWFLVRDKFCWWLAAEVGRFAANEKSSVCKRAGFRLLVAPLTVPKGTKNVWENFYQIDTIEKIDNAF